MIDLNDVFYTHNFIFSSKIWLTLEKIFFRSIVVSAANLKIAQVWMDLPDVIHRFAVRTVFNSASRGSHPTMIIAA